MKTSAAKWIGRRLAAAVAVAIAATGRFASAEEVDARLYELDVSFVEVPCQELAKYGGLDKNRTDAAALLEILARPGHGLRAMHRIVVRPGEESFSRRVTEYRYPTEFQVQVSRNAVSTNKAAGVFATVEPQSFEMREVGSIVAVRLNPTGDDGLVNLEFKAELVDEPTWMNFGVEADWYGAETLDLPMEQPFFPVKEFDSELTVRLGRTFVLGGTTDCRQPNEVALVFIKVDRVRDAVGGRPAPAPSDARAPQVNVGLDVQYVQTSLDELSAIGYLGTNRMDAATLRARLEARRSPLAFWSRVVVRPGMEAEVKCVQEYRYPEQYNVNMAVPGAKECGLAAGGAVVEPQLFKTHNVGARLKVEPTLTNGGELIGLEFKAQLVGQPTWKDYGAKAHWAGATTYDLPMAQPFFPCLANVENSVVMKPGETLAFGAGGKDNGGDTVLVFVTPRIVEP